MIPNTDCILFIIFIIVLLSINELSYNKLEVVNKFG